MSKDTLTFDEIFITGAYLTPTCLFQHYAANGTVAVGIFLQKHRLRRARTYSNGTRKTSSDKSVICLYRVPEA